MTWSSGSGVAFGDEGLRVGQDRQEKEAGERGSRNRTAERPRGGVDAPGRRGEQEQDAERSHGSYLDVQRDVVLLQQIGRKALRARARPRPPRR